MESTPWRLMPLFMLCIFLILFQNCGPLHNFEGNEASLNQLSGDVMKSLRSFGNATGYDGQVALTGTYYDLHSSYTCLGAVKYRSLTFENPQDLYRPYQDHATDPCNSSPSPLNPTSIEVASYNLRLLGQGPDIYEKLMPSTPHTEVTKVWCRNTDTASEGFDVIVRKNSSAGVWTAQILTGKLVNEAGLFVYQKIEVPSFEVTPGQGSALKFEAKDFALSIGGSQLNSGKYQGHLHDKVDGKEYEMNILCRMKK